MRGGSGHNSISAGRDRSVYRICLACVQSTGLTSVGMGVLTERLQPVNACMSGYLGPFPPLPLPHRSTTPWGWLRMELPEKVEYAGGAAPLSSSLFDSPPSSLDSLTGYLRGRERKVGALLSIVTVVMHLSYL